MHTTDMASAVDKSLPSMNLPRTAAGTGDPATGIGGRQGLTRYFGTVVDWRESRDLDDDMQLENSDFVILKSWYLTPQRR
jgi:hypothetical protein